MANIDDVHRELVSFRRWAETRLNVLNTDLGNMWNKLEEIEDSLRPPAEVESEPPTEAELCRRAVPVDLCADCAHHGQCSLEDSE